MMSKRFCMAISQTLQLEDFQVMEFASAQGVIEKLSLDWSGVIVSDINLPGKSGLELFEDVKKIDAEIPFILITGHGDISMAVSAIRDGAYDFIEKPFSNEDFLEVVRRASEKRRLTLENRNLRLELVAQNAPGPRIIGNTPGIHRLRQALLHVADTGADILIQGKRGQVKSWWHVIFMNTAPVEVVHSWRLTVVRSPTLLWNLNSLVMRKVPLPMLKPNVLVNWSMPMAARFS